jgi:E3 ubiquitin-protein ligase SIAH1
MSVPTEALNKVKCGVCNKYLSYFPIHIDKDKTAVCGRCSELLTDDKYYVRDGPYETMAQFLKFPCIYNSEGCLENLTPIDIPNHEKNCPYRIISCPLDCMWQSTVNELQDHFEQLHANSILRTGEFEMDFLSSYETYSLLIYKDEVFCFKRKLDEAREILQVSLFCYKTIDPVTKYNYELTVKNNSNSLSVKFPPKSAENFDEENVTEMNVEHVKKELNDPLVIVGSVKIYNKDEKQDTVAKKNPSPQINFDMLSELECPVCFEYIIPPIFQCITGHSICSACKSKIVECPTCKGEIKNTQNFTLEKMAFLLTYPCRFSEYGCDFASKPGQIKQHQKYCEHGPQSCPLTDYENCKWENASKEVYAHVVNAHHDSILDIDSVTVFIDNENYFQTEDQICYILKFSSSLFKLHYRYWNDTFYWAMQLVGPPEQARSYKFEIDITDNTKNNQRIFLRSHCAPLAEKDQSFDVIGTYVFLKRDQISFLLTDMLTYRVRIIK